MVRTVTRPGGSDLVAERHMTTYKLITQQLHHRITRCFKKNRGHERAGLNCRKIWIGIPEWLDLGHPDWLDLEWVFGLKPFHSWLSFLHLLFFFLFSRLPLYQTSPVLFVRSFFTFFSHSSYCSISLHFSFPTRSYDNINLHILQLYLNLPISGSHCISPAGQLYPNRLLTTIP